MFSFIKKTHTAYCSRPEWVRVCGAGPGRVLCRARASVLLPINNSYALLLPDFISTAISSYRYSSLQIQPSTFTAPYSFSPLHLHLKSPVHSALYSFIMTPTPLRSVKMSEEGKKIV